MRGIENPFKTPPEHLADLKLNAVIANMDTLEKTGLVDLDAAHEQATRLDPYMTRAVGHLALAVQQHKNFHRDIYGPHMMPALAPVHLIREGRSVGRAKREIAAGYAALAQPTE